MMYGPFIFECSLIYGSPMRVRCIKVSEKARNPRESLQMLAEDLGKIDVRNKAVFFLLTFLWTLFHVVFSVTISYGYKEDTVKALNEI